MSHWELWLLGWALSALLLLGLYLVQRHTRDATAVDAGWAASLVLCAVLYAVLGPGEPAQRLLIAIPVALENGRIASLVRTRLGRGEDSRYRELRRRWRERGREQLTFGIFYQAQAFLAAVLSVPALLACFQPRRVDRGGAMGRARALRRRLRPRGDGRPAARRLQGGSRQPRRGDARRPVAVLPSSELLLPDADLGRLCADRAAGAVGLARVPRTGADPVPRPLRHRPPAGGGVVAALARRCLPPLPAGDGQPSSRGFRSARRPPDRVGPRARPAPARRDPGHVRRPAAPRAAPRARRQAGVRGGVARLADRRAGGEGERAALRGAGRVLRARPRPAPEVQLVPLAGRRRDARRGRGGDARPHLRARGPRGRHGPSSSSAAAGARSRCGSRSATRARESSRCRTRVPQREIDRGARATLERRGRHRRRERVRRSTAASTASSRSRCSSTCATTRRCSAGSRVARARMARSSSTSSRHTRFAYPYDATAGWRATFFTGGQMPSRRSPARASSATSARATLARVGAALRAHGRGLARAPRRAPPRSTRARGAYGPGAAARWADTGASSSWPAPSSGATAAGASGSSRTTCSRGGSRTRPRRRPRRGRRRAAGHRPARTAPPWRPDPPARAERGRRAGGAPASRTRAARDRRS